MPPKANRSADRHLGAGHFTRLDGPDEARFQAYMLRTGLAAGRVIKRAVREFLDRDEPTTGPEGEPK